MFNSIKAHFIAAAAASVFCMAAGATEVTCAGSSFVQPVISKWSVKFYEDTGHQLSYNSVGSGAGIKLIEDRSVDCGTSDKPLDQETLAKNDLGQFPDVIGGIVPVFNIPGVGDGGLVLDGKTLARIFLGDITHWNDEAIATLNPGVKLPNAAINVVHRSDGSGTTYNFTHYLSQVSDEWKSKIGQGTAVTWPTASNGGEGNEGVSADIKRTENSIGYVEYAFSVQNHISYARMKNAAGRVVTPNAESFQAAADTADWKHAKNFELLITNAPGEKAWPITATSWVIMHKHAENPQKTKVLISFFRSAYTKNEYKNEAKALGYVPLPDDLVNLIKNYWKAEYKL